MEKELLVAFQNFGRPLFLIEQNLPKITFPYIIASNKLQKECGAGSGAFGNMYLSLAGSNSPANGKNLILEYAKNNGYKYCMIVEDDVIIIKQDIIEKYLTLIKKYDIGVIFFGYGGLNNRVFMKPNPRLLIKTGEDEFVAMNSIPCSALQIFNMEKAVPFNPELKYLDQKDHLVKMHKAGHIPFLGMFLDVAGSETSLTTSTEVGPSSRPKKHEEMMVESMILKNQGVEYKAENDLNSILKWVANKNGKEL